MLRPSKGGVVIVRLGPTLSLRLREREREREREGFESARKRK